MHGRPVLHREKGGRAHVHVLAARCDLETGRSLNIAPPGWENLRPPLGPLDPAEQREFHRIIDEQTEHMQDLISNLLDAGRIDSATLSVTPEPSEVAALVDRASNTSLGGGARHTINIGPLA